MYKTIKETRDALKSGAITSVALVESSVKNDAEDMKDHPLDKTRIKGIIWFLLPESQ